MAKYVFFVEVPESFPLHRHWADSIAGTYPSESDMVDGMADYIQRLHNIPYKRRTFPFLNNMKSLKKFRRDLPTGKCIA